MLAGAALAVLQQQVLTLADQAQVKSEDCVMTLGFSCCYSHPDQAQSSEG